MTAVVDRAHSKRFDKALQGLAEIDDPYERLDAVRECRERIEQLELGSVLAAREAGATWRDIGSLYGLSKQGAQQRFRRAVDQAEPRA